MSMIGRLVDIDRDYRIDVGLVLCQSHGSVIVLGLNFFDFHNVLEIGDLSMSVMTTVSILVLFCAKVMDLSSSWV